MIDARGVACGAGMLMGCGATLFAQAMFLGFEPKWFGIVGFALVMVGLLIRLRQD